MPDIKAVKRAAMEMRVQCGKSSDGPWEELSLPAQRRWIKRAEAVLAAAIEFAQAA